MICILDIFESSDYYALLVSPSEITNGRFPFYFLCRHKIFRKKNVSLEIKVPRSLLQSIGLCSMEILSYEVSGKLRDCK